MCILVAFAIDSYSFETGSWRWGSAPLNNVIIPLVLAPPLLLYLLSKLRELAVAHHELSIVASTDVLTSCLNRRAFTAMVDAYLARVANQEAKREGALLIIDVDYFKHINDNFGHECGDEALKIIAQTIKGVVREIDLVGRMGGEEFSVFLPGTDPSRTKAVAERIRVAIATVEFYPTENRCDLSVSVGGATLDGEDTFTSCSGAPISGFMRPSRMAATASRSTTRHPMAFQLRTSCTERAARRGPKLFPARCKSIKR